MLRDRTSAVTHCHVRQQKALVVLCLLAFFCIIRFKVVVCDQEGSIVREQKKQEKQSPGPVQRGFGCRQPLLAAPSINLSVMR